MEDPQLVFDGDSDDLLGLINWDAPLDGLPENFLDSPEEPMSSWIGEIENLLMKDDDERADDLIPSHQFDEFLADILADSPADASSSGRSQAESPLDVSSGEVADVSTDKDSDHGDTCPSDEDKEREEARELAKEVDAKEDGEDPDDPNFKKRRRQLRNRDAAVRSRERKKMYVKDLEMKSKYLEAECRRLGRLLQCFVAENQALKLSLHNGSGAFDVSKAKQESAVLLLESLLLGSLLWFLGIMCLFNVPQMPQSNLVEVPTENGEEKIPQNVVQRGAKSKILGSMAISRRCKASRTKMKMRLGFLVLSESWYEAHLISVSL